MLKRIKLLCVHITVAWFHVLMRHLTFLIRIVEASGEAICRGEFENFTSL